MLKKSLIKAFIIISIAICALSFCGCSQQTKSYSKDKLSDRITFGKKYYYLGYESYTQNEYYTFNNDGTACYTHIMKNGELISFHQAISFKWTYIGEGNCILIHNGTQIIKGVQDDAFGISRVIHVSKEIMYWSASGENTYFICEDFLSQIPNYAKLIKSS